MEIDEGYTSELSPSVSTHEALSRHTSEVDDDEKATEDISLENYSETSTDGCSYSVTETQHDEPSARKLKCKRMIGITSSVV